MQAKSSGSAMSDINVTPMIDVILVLLIIFMVITPVVQMGYLAKVPKPAPEKKVGDFRQIVLRYDADGTIWINKEQVSREEFVAKLAAALGGNPGKMVFFAGDPNAEYQETMEFLDLAGQAGASNIGIVVDDLAVSRIPEF